MNQQQGYKIHVIHSFDDAGKIWCCRTAHRPAVNMLSLGCDATTIINIALQAVCYTNEQQGYKIHVIHSLMMLARFGAAGLLTDQQSTCCLSAVTQRAIINIASAGSVLHK
jgi:hypothetical protein